MKMHNLNTTDWNSFPFEANGIKFVSKIAPTSPFMARIAKLPAGVFDSMNRGAVSECVGNNLSRDEIATRLYNINLNATHAVLELAGN
jgi:hypothetical protein